MSKKDSAHPGRASRSILAMSLVCFSSRINNYYVFAFYHYSGDDGSIYDCLLDSMGWWQSVDDKAVFVFVGDAKALHSEWLESVSPTDGLGRDALDFCNLLGFEQLERGLTHIAGNRLDLMMTDS